MHTIQEIAYKGKNLLYVSIIGLSGLSFLPEAFVEKDVPDKLDDIALFILGIIAVIWYMKAGNKYKRSLALPIMMTIGLVIKIIGLIIELDDPDSLGDDIGGVILFVSATILTWVQYAKKEQEG